MFSCSIKRKCGSKRLNYSCTLLYHLYIHICIYFILSLIYLLSYYFFLSITLRVITYLHCCSIHTSILSTLLLLLFTLPTSNVLYNLTNNFQLSIILYIVISYLYYTLQLFSLAYLTHVNTNTQKCKVNTIFFLTAQLTIIIFPNPPFTVTWFD